VKRLFVFGLACALLAPPAPVRADDSARAEELFREGKRLYGDGRLDAACAALAESDRLEPAVGTLGMLAACDERRGKLLSALRAYQEVARRAAAVDDERGAFAQKRADVLDRRVPRLTIEAADAKTVIRVDGEVQDRQTLRSPLRRDPGPVRVEATHADASTFAHDAVLEEGASLVVAIPAPAEASRPAPGSEHGPPWAAIGAASVGVAGLLVMTGFGLSAASANGDSEDRRGPCEAGSGAACAEGAALREDASAAAGVATVGFAVGVAGLVTGAVLWALHGGEPAPATVTTSRQGARLHVTF
jgi:hypothetical protein